MNGMVEHDMMDREVGMETALDRALRRNKISIHSLCQGALINNYLRLGPRKSFVFRKLGIICRSLSFSFSRLGVALVKIVKESNSGE